ncbi:MAG: rane-bound lytic murein transglycosylase [Methylobacteriaceae bacterium]|jgi:lytic murein transglycosylase|nr:rane-bound lytic murein transglycosylase [Methylobacteriaceae bacterium]
MSLMTRRATLAGAATLGLCVLNANGFAEDQATGAPQAGEFQQFLASIWPAAEKAGVSRATFDAAISGLTPDQAILTRTTRQAEFTITVAQYVAQSATPKRAAQGRDVAAKLADPLEKLQARSGVPWEILVALWGIESNYGTSAGNSDILRVLATLAFKQHRGSLFLDEFVAALVMLEKGYATRSQLAGSWAGAMGQPQFMPSSYLNYAVAYEGSRPADIWSSNKDVLASIGNFMQKAGWLPGLPWGVEVVIPAAFDYAALRKPFGEWQAQGFRAASGKPLPNTADATLYMPAGAKGPTWLITDNFFVIKQYNTSDAYALSVGLLAQQIAGEGGIRTPWPKDMKPLSVNDGKTAQQALTKLGLYRGNIDGKIGPAMRDAVHAYQIKAGIQPADGFITPALVQKLKSEAAL